MSANLAGTIITVVAIICYTLHAIARSYKFSYTSGIFSFWPVSIDAARNEFMSGKSPESVPLISDDRII